MHYVFDKDLKRVGSIVQLVGGDYSLAFSRRLQGQIRDFCGKREQVWSYLRDVCPGATVKNIGSAKDALAAFVGKRASTEELIANLAGGTLRDFEGGYER